jgi:NhaP-type Na+/H+ or K+/H+ antiporter
VLGPGTLLSAALIAVAGWGLLGLAPAAAAILGAALASTDPVLLRGLLQGRDLAPGARQALRLESGLNDVVLLPIVVVAMAFLSHETVVNAAHLARLGVDLFLLGPGLGVAIGLVGVATLELVRRQVGVRRDYESLYSLGVAFSAYAAAEAVHGSGFLAAFAAGLTIASVDVELCDCFLEYGEATAEMLLLLTFVAFGMSLIWTGFSVADARTLAFAILALAARTLVLYPVLTWIGVRGRDRALIAWFGPRGLSSLLLVLLPVLAGIAGSDRWFTITALVVMLSLVGHGAIIGWYLQRGQRHRRPLPHAGAEGEAVATTPEIITIPDVRRMQAAGEPLVFVDARSDRNYRSEDRTIPESVRVDPDDAVRSAVEQQLSKTGTLVVYCA